MTVAQTARRLLVTRHGVTKLVDDGRLPVAARSAGRAGAFLFRPADVERLAGELADEARQRAAELEAATG